MCKEYERRFKFDDFMNVHNNTDWQPELHDKDN